MAQKTQFGTTFDRVKYLARRISKTVNREQANIGEAKLAGDYHIEDMVKKFSTIDGMEIPEKLVSELVYHIHKRQQNMVESKHAAEIYIQSIIDENGKFIPMPDMIVSERDGKTVFEYIDQE